MLSPGLLDVYRRMTMGERLALTLKMIDEQWPAMLSGPPEIVARRFELLRRENDLRNYNMLKGIARTRDPADDAGQSAP